MRLLAVQLRVVCRPIVRNRLLTLRHLKHNISGTSTILSIRHLRFRRRIRVVTQRPCTLRVRKVLVRLFILTRQYQRLQSSITRNVRINCNVILPDTCRFMCTRRPVRHITLMNKFIIMNLGRVPNRTCKVATPIVGRGVLGLPLIIDNGTDGINTRQEMTMVIVDHVLATTRRNRSKRRRRYHPRYFRYLALRASHLANLALN